MPAPDPNATPLPPPDPEATRKFFAAIQDENGVDLTLILENLRLTPIERLRKADRSRRSALRLMELGRLSRERRTKSA